MKKVNNKIETSEYKKEKLRQLNAKWTQLIHIQKQKKRQNKKYAHASNLLSL